MSAPAVIDRVKRNLVGLKMPRALEILDVTLRGIERGEIAALEAIDALLTEELTHRENRRVNSTFSIIQPVADRSRLIIMNSPCYEHNSLLAENIGQV